MRKDELKKLSVAQLTALKTAVQKELTLRKRQDSKEEKLLARFRKMAEKEGPAGEIAGREGGQEGPGEEATPARQGGAEIPESREKIRDLEWSRAQASLGPGLAGPGRQAGRYRDPLDFVSQACLRCMMISCHCCGPLWCTALPFTSTATVTGMSWTSNSWIASMPSSAKATTRADLMALETR